MVCHIFAMVCHIFAIVALGSCAALVFRLAMDMIVYGRPRGKRAIMVYLTSDPVVYIISWVLLSAGVIIAWCH